MTVDPRKAWADALELLRAEIERAAFDTWVRDAVLVSYSDGAFVIGARNSFARDWLEVRLSDTLTKLLGGLAGRDVAVSFVVHGEDPGAEAEVRAPAAAPANGVPGDPSDLQVELVHDTTYSAEVVPDSVVVIDGYALRLLELGDIDHNQLSLYLGFHQAVWRQWKQGKGAVQNVSWRDVCSWAMMSRAIFFKLIANLPVVKGADLASPGKGCGQAMYGLVERVEIGNARHYRYGNGIRTIANRYRVHMSPRLARADASALEALLRSRLVEGGGDIFSALTSALEELHAEPRIVDVLNQVEVDPVRPADLLPATTVMDVVRRIAGAEGEISARLKGAAEKLHTRIVGAFGKVFFTQYFITTVVPALRLTRPQAWLIAWLRDKCYEDKRTGEKRDFVVIDGGVTELARRVGISADSIWAWLSEDEQGNPSTPVSCFVARMEFDQVPDDFRARGTVIFRVRMEEPLVSDLLDRNGGKPLRKKHGGGRVARKCKDCKRDVYELGEVFRFSREALKAMGLTRSSVVCLKCAGKRLGRGLTSLDYDEAIDGCDTIDKQPRLETPENRDLRHKQPRLETPEPRLETPAYRNLRLVAPRLETPFKLFNRLLNSDENSQTTTSDAPPVAAVIPSSWNLTRLFVINPTNSRVRIALAHGSPTALISWLLYSVSPMGQGIERPWGWALSQLRDSPESGAGGPYDRLAELPPRELVRLIRYSFMSATKNYRTADGLLSKGEGSGNALWDETMGTRNARAGYLLKILLGLDPEGGADVSWEKETTTIEYRGD